MVSHAEVLRWRTGVAVAAETANARPRASWAPIAIRALGVEQQHTAPTRCLGLATWLLLSGEVSGGVTEN
jgi:hypothetical protein